ncbi:MAG: NPCBM/NEW2 domain-containing protein [Fimbriimonadaceae bacterium]|nr:NPCBM/NEW2 domain-containing protein [Fimbriimonadaceae bacterium]
MTALALTILLSTSLAAPEFYVAPTGADTNAGTLAAPFATLERARDAVRGTGGTVVLRGGVYRRSATLALTAADSGVTWAAYPGEQPRLLGGLPLPAAAFQPVRDAAVLARLPQESRGQVLVADLAALGVTDYGKLESYGHGRPAPTPIPELFVNGRAQTLARYPKDGWLELRKVLDRGSVWGSNVPGEPELREKPDRGAIFEVDDPHLARWATAPDLWLFGYWWWDWADQAVQVAAIDLAKKTIQTVQPHAYGYRAGGRYYAYNLLEELSAPGEYFLDRATGRLYLLPAVPLAGADITFSQLTTPLLTIDGASNLTVRGLTFECSRVGALRLTNCRASVVRGCTFRQLASTAVNVNGGERCTVRGCDIYDANGGITLTGGDRAKLQPAGHVAENNHFWNYARINRTYISALALHGVGLRASHNLIHGAPHMAIGFGGNDLVMEYNEIYDVCRESNDAGAIYTGRNWSMRGNVIRYNYLHDIHGLDRKGAAGIYLDDCFSSADVIGNVLVDMKGLPFLIGGGRDNVIEDNVTLRTGAFHLDDRGLGWGKRGAAPDGELTVSLKQMPYQSELWRQRYPQLAGILDDNPGAPKGNVVRRNLFVQSPTPQIAGPARQYGNIADNWVAAEDPGFVNLALGDLRLRPDAVALQRIPGFRPPPFEQMGLRVDEDRPTLPPALPAAYPAGGAFCQELAVQVGCRTPGAVLRYTLDGSPPTSASPVCPQPLTLTRSGTLTVIAQVGTQLSEAARYEFRAYALGAADPLPVSLLPTLAADGYSEPKVNTNMAGRPISLRGGAYPTGLTLHPKEQPGGGRATAVYALDGTLRRATRLRGTVGVEDTSGANGSVVCRVELLRDGQWAPAFDSGVLCGGQATKELDVSLTGATQIRLVVTDAGDNIHSDHAAWGGLRLE